jgi:hypothetical protein
MDIFIATERKSIKINRAVSEIQRKSRLVEMGNSLMSSQCVALLPLKA